MLRAAIILILSAISFNAFAGTGAEGDAAGEGVVSPRVDPDYGKIPLRFELNEGQVHDDVDFLARGLGYSLFLTPSEAVMVFNKVQDQNLRASALENRIDRALHYQPPEYESSVLRMRLVNAEPKARPVPESKLPGTTSHFKGDRSNWRTDLPNYQKVRYEDIYEGVDLVYYGNQGQLEYDFVVSPGADPDTIALEFEGAEGATIDDDGNLWLTLGDNEVAFKAPVIYQLSDSQREPVEGRYKRLADSRIGFELAAYDTTRPLVIDPVLAYSTYLGGSGAEREPDIAVDADGHAYIAAHTMSTDYPDTGAGTKPGGSWDIVVSKLSVDGSSLEYSSYFGGSGADTFPSLAVDDAGRAYVAITTSSTDFPMTSGTYDKFYNGHDDVAVFRVHSGGALDYSTYLGGSLEEGAQHLGLDGDGNVYISLYTFSKDFPVVGSAQSPKETLVFVKLNIARSELLRSTPLVDGLSTPSDLVVDESGTSYISVLNLGSSNFPTTSGALHLDLDDGEGAASPVTTAFLKVNTQGEIVYSAAMKEAVGGLGLAVDADGNLISGVYAPLGVPFPVTSDAYDTEVDSIFQHVVFKLSADGSRLIYATNLEGTFPYDPDKGTDVNDSALFVWDVAVDAAGNAYLFGRTDAADFPMVRAIQPRFKGGLSDGSTTNSDPVLAKLSADGSTLEFSTYISGTSGDLPGSVAVDEGGDVYLAVETISDDFPTTEGAFGTTRGGNVDIALTKIDMQAPTPHYAELLYVFHDDLTYSGDVLVSEIDKIRLFAVAVDSDPTHELGYSWSSFCIVGSGDTFDDPSSPSTVWTAPDVPPTANMGQCSIGLEVTHNGEVLDETWSIDDIPVQRLPHVIQVHGSDYSTEGPPVGPFSPESASYVIKNAGDEPVGWQASVDVDWASIEPAAGELEPGESHVATLTINANAAEFGPGTYAGTTWIRKSTTVIGGSTFGVSLTVPQPTIYVPSWVDSEGTATVYTSVVSTADNPRTFEWSDDCGGSFENPTARSTVYHAPLVQGTDAICVMSLDVTSSDSGQTDTLRSFFNISRASDAEPPVISLNGDDPVVIEAGEDYIEPGATATDNIDGDVTVDIDGAVDTTTPGVYTVTYSAADSAGNTASTTRTVEVEDTTPPTVTAPADITMEATGPTTEVSLGDATATDVVDGTLEATPSETGPFSAGTHTVTWSATDAAGNTGNAEQTVTIIDTTPPEVSAPTDITIEATGPTTEVVLGEGTASDLVDGAVEAISDIVGPFSVGTHTVTWSATDAAGNTGNAEQTVTVIDTTPPAVSAPADITIEATGPTTEVLLGDAIATDIVDGTLAAIPNTTGPFSVGMHTIIWSATDAAGNTGANSQVITVQDTTPPEVTAPPDVEVDATGDLTEVELGDAAASDIVDGALEPTPDASGPFSQGVHEIDWVAVDGAGNSASAVQVVTVLGPEEIISDIESDIRTMDLNGGTTRGLMSKLDSAMHALADNNPRNDKAAANSLSALINSIRAQQGKKIPSSDAQGLIDRLGNLVELI